MKSSTKTMLILTSMLIWGVSYPLVKLLLNKGVPPITLATLRHVVFIPMMIIVLLRKSYKKYSKKDWGFFLALAFFTIFLPNISQNIGMLYTTASISSIIQSTSPVFTILLAFIFLKETKTVNKIIGSLVALIGTILLSTKGNLSFNLYTLGNLLILVSSISYAISGVILKMGLSRIPAFDLLCFETTFGFFMLLGANIFLEDISIIGSFGMELWFYIFLLSVLASFIAAILYYRILYEEELSHLVIFTYLIPVFAIIFSYFMLGEILSAKDILFASIVLIGVALAQLKSRTFGN